MKPTVGRIVHYHSRTPALVAAQTADGKNVALEYTGPFAAMVLFVHGDGSAVLHVHAPPGAGALGFHDAVTAKQAPADKPTPGHWNWPPRE